ncbi:MAG TPA: hypothetical protein VK155_14305 [Bacteroidales bacterium]|jgi:hypothetical protein|nr:hypothetical protein [Bacteroidales bacterium]
MDPDQVLMDESFHQDEEAKPFIVKFADYSADQLNGIITKYISYEPGAVIAALYLSVQKGLISYDLKEQLRSQIGSNYKRHKNHIRAYDWEKNNAFAKYFSAFTDDQIYDIIEKPGDIVIDVYFAVLMVARERELISGEDFNMYCRDAKSGSLIEHVSSFDYAGHTSSIDSEDIPCEEELEAEKKKFWKCPNCNHVVGIEFGTCWNCGKEIPQVVEHPGDAEIINEIREAEPKIKGLIRPGFALLIIGIFVSFFEYNRTYHSSFAQHTRFIDVGFGILIAATGLVLLSFGIWMHFNKRAD